ncbi:hypothetical protein BDK92_5365 [Micromonospora pisi]|uniref:Uncharacterized protein n=1 Tax=Micromonospora pisi TaxID=589240 RepID=A0A495JQ53_9ACTN|nr:hypothetical protein [Micromonospora pisi]RKR90981.1 hypothetical protein BDK92_5365 [Micromonospora pisi]
MRPVLIISGRHPFEVTLLAAAVVCGVGLLLSDARPRSVTVAMPLTVQATWEIGLIVGGVLGLVGVSWRGQLSTGLGLELGAIVLFGTTTGMYAIALLAISGRSGLAAGTFVAAVSAASYWRTVQIVRDLRRLARVGTTCTLVDVPLLVERESP